MIALFCRGAHIVVACNNLSFEQTLNITPQKWFTNLSVNRSSQFDQKGLPIYFLSWSLIVGLANGIDILDIKNLYFFGSRTNPAAEPHLFRAPHCSQEEV